MSNLVERLRMAERNSAQTVMGSTIFAQAADEIERLQKECEDKDRVIRAGINTAKRLRAALERISECHISSTARYIAREALRDEQPTFNNRTGTP